MAVEGQILATAVAFPNVQPARAIARGQQHAVGTVVDAQHPVGVLFDFRELFGVGRLVKLDQAIGSAQRDQRLLIVDVGRQHAVPFVAHGDGPLAALDVPNYGLAAFGTAAAGGQQQLSVGAEGQMLDLPFFKRQDADQFQRVGVVQQDLPLTRDRHDRGPGAAGNRGDLAGPRGPYHRLQRQLAGHRGFAGPTGIDVVERQINLGLGRHPSPTGLGFESPQINELGEGRQAGIVNFVAVGRHGGRIEVGRQLVQAAAVGIARFDDGP